jgi:hypothetical protein
MKSPENGVLETSEVKATNSRAARMARYSTAAAGVAALSAVDVDAAMIKVLVTDAQNKTDYTLDLGGIASGAQMYLSMSGLLSLYINSLSNASVVTYSSSSSYLRFLIMGVR